VGGEVHEGRLSTWKDVSGGHDLPISLEEAKDVRLKLTEERGVQTRRQNEDFEAHDFCLCEH